MKRPNHTRPWWMVSLMLIAVVVVLGAVAPSSLRYGHAAPALASSSRLCSPQGVTFTPSSYLVASNTEKGQINIYSPTGRLLEVWGSWGSGRGQLRMPMGLAADRQGNIYIADFLNNRIVVLHSSGSYRTTHRAPHLRLVHIWLGFHHPTGIALEPYVPQDIDVADYGANRVVRLLSTGQVTFIFTNVNGSRFSAPHDVAVDSRDNIVVADTFNHRIVKITGTGTPPVIMTAPNSGPGHWFAPQGVAVDRHDNVYAADTARGHVDKFSPQGRPLAVWGSSGHGRGHFIEPHSVSVDSEGNVYVADTGNSRIVKLSPSGTWLAAWR